MADPAGYRRCDLGSDFPLEFGDLLVQIFQGVGPGGFWFLRHRLAGLRFLHGPGIRSAFADPGHGVLSFFSHHLSQRPLPRPGPDGSALRLQLCADRFMEFIPVLARRAANVRDAQRARGIPVGVGWKGLRYLPALLGPLLIQAFKLADEMAEALEARGFGSPGHRRGREIRFLARDWLIVSMSLAGLLAFFLLR
ncbi:MAG: energy-coupling factor transporter transmembrane protein EcfT, partial [Desulfobacteraceae bacterium]